MRMSWLVLQASMTRRNLRRRTFESQGVVLEDGAQGTSGDVINLGVPSKPAVVSVESRLLIRASFSLHEWPLLLFLLTALEIHK
jgi:hypothetical protein